MPGLLDDLINRLRLNYGPRWEGAVGLPQMPTRPEFAQQGGIRSVDEARDVAKRGAVDPTMENLGKIGSLASMAMSGTGVLGGALQGIASQTNVGKKLGIENPFDEMSGFAKPTGQQLAGITSGNPTTGRSQAARVQERAYADRKAREKALADAREAATSRGQRGLGGNMGGGGSSSGSRGGSSREGRGV